MWEDFKDKTYEEIFLSRDNIVIKVNREFLKLTGYGQGEILGKGLGEIERLLRIDSQVNLEDLEDELEINLFTKDLVPVEGLISSRTLQDGKERSFTFKGKINDCLSQKFKFADQLGTSRGDGVAVFNFPGLILINTNQNYLDFLEAPYNQKSVSLGKSLIEISIERWDSKLNDIRNYILETGKPYYDEEIGINSRGTKLYWNINLIPIFKEVTNSYYKSIKM